LAPEWVHGRLREIDFHEHTVDYRGRRYEDLCAEPPAEQAEAGSPTPDPASEEGSGGRPDDKLAHEILAAAPKRRGPKSRVEKAVTAAMLADLRNGKRTETSLDEMKQESLAAEYRVSR
jgi:hypothetical protein